MKRVLELENKIEEITFMIKALEVNDELIYTLTNKRNDYIEEVDDIKSSTAYVLDLQDFLDETCGDITSIDGLFTPIHYAVERDWASSELEKAKNKNKGRWSPILFHCYSCRHGNPCDEFKKIKTIKSD